MSLNAQQRAMLSPDEIKVYGRCTPDEQRQFRELLDAHAAALAKADAKLAKQDAAIRKWVVRDRVAEALAKAGAGKHADLLAPHVAARVRVTERDGEIAGFHVVDQDGKPRIRDGRPMQVEELLREMQRMPELERYFTNGRKP